METILSPEPNIFRSRCRSRQALELIADEWTALVIYALESGTTRFNQLLRQIEGISKKMLTQTLRKLERDGLVVRQVYAVIPPRVEYTLTPLGQTLLEPINALRRWAEDHMNDVAAARGGYDQTVHTPLPEITALLVQNRA